MLVMLTDAETGRPMAVNPAWVQRAAQVVRPDGESWTALFWAGGNAQIGGGFVVVGEQLGEVLRRVNEAGR